MIGRACWSLEVWNCLHHQVIQLQVLQRKYASAIMVDKELPNEYLLALLKFSHRLDRYIGDPINQLRDGWIASPPFRSDFAVLSHDNKDTIALKAGAMRDKVQSELVWLLDILGERRKEVDLAGRTILIDELERFLQAEPKAKALVSSHLAAVLGDLSVINEATRQLDLYQPWASTFRHHRERHEDAMDKDFTDQVQSWGHFGAVLRLPKSGPDHAELVRLGEPSERKFYHPVDKRRTKRTMRR